MPISFEKNIEPKKYFPDAKHIIEYAFSLGDTHYFQYHDAFNIPAERALSTITFYREVDLNCSRAYLQAHTEAVINYLTPTAERLSIEAGRALDLERQLQLRMQLPKDTELMYKLASAVFFDQHENPLVYEYDYGSRKIAKWKEETTLKDFFLQKAMTELIPYLEHVGENLDTYDTLMKATNEIHLENLRLGLSKEQSTKLNA